MLSNLSHRARTALQFRVFGVVVDKKMLLRIGTTLAGLLATGIPIVFGLRPDLNEEFTQINATDTTQGQLLGLQAQSAALQQQLAEQSQQLTELSLNRT